MDKGFVKQLKRWYGALYERRYMVVGFLGLVILWRFCLYALGTSPMAHDPQDSYTLQAMAWRKGFLHLDRDYPWLELAIYQGHYWVSFPPVPSLVIFPLTFIFGGQIPNILLNFAYLLAGYLTGYSIGRKTGRSDGVAAAMALFLVVGCNMFSLCLRGGVWYQAQMLSFLLTLLAFRLLMGEKPLAWGAGLVSIALAVGCRPFQAVYVPFLLYMAFKNIREKEKRTPGKSLVRLAALCIAPAVIALCYGVFNTVRFGNPLEFGHSYLPEFSTQGGVQFALSHVPKNIANMMRLPYVEEGVLRFPTHYGSAFYLTNPIVILLVIGMIRAAVMRRVTLQDGALLALILLHFFLLLLQRTFGSWQFGARYIMDMIPAMYFMLACWRLKPRIYEGALMAFGVVVNIYGALLWLMG